MHSSFLPHDTIVMSVKYVQTQQSTVWHATYALLVNRSPVQHVLIPHSLPYWFCVTLVNLTLTLKHMSLTQHSLQCVSYKRFSYFHQRSMIIGKYIDLFFKNIIKVICQTLHGSKNGLWHSVESLYPCMILHVLMLY